VAVVVKFVYKIREEVVMTDIVKVDGLVETYVKLRDFKAKVSAELKEKEAKIELQMERIEGELMTFLNQTGQESANTKAGTFFKRTTTSAKVADRDVFLKFVFDTDNPQFLESRVSKTAVDQYIEAHGAIPPGIDVQRVTSVAVNRPKTRS
jgi:hypothetical protein